MLFDDVSAPGAAVLALGAAVGVIIAVSAAGALEADFSDGEDECADLDFTDAVACFLVTALGETDLLALEASSVDPDSADEDSTDGDLTEEDLTKEDLVGEILPAAFSAAVLAGMGRYTP